MVRELGGNAGVAQLIQRTPPNVTNWMNTGKIPAKYYWTLIYALEERAAKRRVRS